MQETSKALQSYSQALEANPDYDKALINRYRLLMSVSDNSSTSNSNISGTK